MKIKKFFPLITVSVLFSLILVAQMAVTGQGSNASRETKEGKLYRSFENEFKKTTLSLTNKTKVKLSEVKEDYVLINFWASWCRPCLSEFESLNKLVAKYPKKLKVVGINNDTENAMKLIRKVEKKYQLKFNSTKDQEGTYADKFNIRRVPASILFHKGKVIHFSNKEQDFMSKKFIKLFR